MGDCCVCGKKTIQRCGPCGQAGFDLFFCSTEHQRLVWPAHKQVCGTRAKPFFPPDLSLNEAALLRKYAHMPLGSQRDELRPGAFQIGRKYSAATYFDNSLGVPGAFDATSDSLLMRSAEVFGPEDQPATTTFLRGLLIRALVVQEAPREEWLALNPSFYPVHIDTVLSPIARNLPTNVLCAALHQSLAFIAIAKARASQLRDSEMPDSLTRENLRSAFHRTFDPLLPFCRFDSRLQAVALFHLFTTPMLDFGEVIDLRVDFNDETGRVDNLDLQIASP